jgi:hypothetical protein
MSDKLNQVYSSILLFSGMKADENGYISSNLNDKVEPAFIDGLRLVLPTKYHLGNFEPKEKMIFHPFTENILRGESVVIEKLKKAINIKLNFTIGAVAQSLLNLVASPEQHGNLTSEQSEILTIVKDADEKSVTDFISQMVSGIRNDAERLFVNIYLKRGGNFQGKRYSRVGIVSFPFYEKLKNQEITKIRVKDREPYKQLFQFMFPNLDGPEEYNFGSESHVAPYLEALLRSAANVASRINDLCIIYKDYIDQAESLMFDADWLEDFRDLNALVPEIRKVPVQNGNDGSLDTNEKVQAVPQVQQVQNPYQPVQQPQMQQQYQPQVQPVKTTKRGLDFKSVMQNSPGVQMAGNMLAPVIMQQNYQQQMLQQQQLQQQHAQAAYGIAPMNPQYPQQPMQQPIPPGFMIAPNGQLVPIQQMQQMQQPMMQPVYQQPYQQPMQPQYHNLNRY